VAHGSKYDGKKVIIVGGGAAGIKIAHNLAKEGVQFVHLE
jgi:cation diffusion facilitator CzcD-associated flavoprotein CzcO